MGNTADTFTFNDVLKIVKKGFAEDPQKAKQWIQWADRFNAKDEMAMKLVGDTLTGLAQLCVASGKTFEELVRILAQHAEATKADPNESSEKLKAIIDRLMGKLTAGGNKDSPFYQSLVETRDAIEERTKASGAHDEMMKHMGFNEGD